jgi:hypothetical protein
MRVDVKRVWKLFWVDEPRKAAVSRGMEDD